MSLPPISPYAETLGMSYFPRMLDKIRKNAKGELREDFLDNLGKSLDHRCVTFLRVSYSEVVERTLAGDSDEEVLEWCYAKGRSLDENDLHIWNTFTRKLGWRDEASEVLARRIKESGLEQYQPIDTMLEYMEYDEGRKP